ncbi:MAG: fused MFS/spermidine synthase [Planctomycetota bacterium]|nr:fused MFS/spermidine synthase [Planctomycetota bacterium]
MGRPARIACLLFGSGLCALIYQVAWLREMRLIFGASHSASAAVLAIFMGGLGLGGLILGKRADRSENPLKLYSQLEFAIAISVVFTPILIDLCRWLYIALGGSIALGSTGATIVRLIFSTLVLAVPTLLMGGTLPAAAKAAETDDDSSRRSLAILYGLNTLGAVTGVLLSTFFLMEKFGNRNTLYCASFLNLGIAGLAYRYAQHLVKDAPQTPESPVAETTASEQLGDIATVSDPDDKESPAPRFVYLSAGLVGFVFLLMELVWYRLLSPLLGGSTYTFGVILAVALTGIALGGAVYSLGNRAKTPSLRAFAITCMLEALFLAIPFALGDIIPTLAMQSRAMSAFGFPGLVFTWIALTSIVVFPAACISGYQFPLLVALLGQGSKDVGQQVGKAYAWNTLGAILGSLAGGFGFLPILTAPGTWRLATASLIVFGLGAVMLSNLSLKKRLLPLAIGVLASFALTCDGPGSFWRHSPIGAGRAKLPRQSPNALRAFKNEIASYVRWEQEGMEMSLALYDHDSFTFVINGKSDGNAKRDRETQIMSGLVGAVLHPNPKKAMVVGLGTGSTAGWLGQIPTMEKVDVVELEPAILEIAKVCHEVNGEVLNNDKVKIQIGDAREALLVSREKYDLIFSEPSNPYRAGIASLYTREFYEASKERLTEDGIFIQWLQGYEVDGQTVRSILATLATAFPNVEIWHTNGFDLLFLATMKPIEYDVPQLRERLATYPYRNCQISSWRSEGLEAFLAHFLADNRVAKLLKEQEGDAINTDDRNLVEYGFARTVGQRDLFRVDEIQEYSRQLMAHKPALKNGAVDQERVEAEAVYIRAMPQYPPSQKPWYSPNARVRVTAMQRHLRRDYRGSLAAFFSLKRRPIGPIELAMVAEGLADAGDPRAEIALKELTVYQPGEALGIRARLLLRQKKRQECRATLLKAFESFRQFPWARDHLMENTLRVAEMLARVDKEAAPVLVKALDKPFAANCLNNYRKTTRMNICLELDNKELTASVLADFEPHIPWQYSFLKRRYEIYKALKNPLADQARKDLEEFISKEPSQLVELRADK